MATSGEHRQPAAGNTVCGVRQCIYVREGEGGVRGGGVWCTAVHVYVREGGGGVWCMWECMVCEGRVCVCVWECMV